MTIDERIEICKRRAKQTKSDYPELGYNKRLDIAAREQGFNHYTQLQKHEAFAVEPERKPSRIDLVLAGGNANESQLRAVDSEFTIS